LARPLSVAARLRLRLRCARLREAPPSMAALSERGANRLAVTTFRTRSESSTLLFII
jgi:hypothetical protein